MKKQTKRVGGVGAQSVVGGLGPGLPSLLGTKGSRPLGAGPKSAGKWQKIHSVEK